MGREADQKLFFALKMPKLSINNIFVNQVINVIDLKMSTSSRNMNAKIIKSSIVILYS